MYSKVQRLQPRGAVVVKFSTSKYTISDESSLICVIPEHKDGGELLQVVGFERKLVKKLF